MNRRNHSRLKVEQLDTRISPSVTPGGFLFQVVDTNVGPTKFTSTTPGTVIKTHNLEATLGVRYTLSGPELATARAASANGYTLNDEIRWREEDTAPADSDVAKTFVSFTTKLTPTTSSFLLNYAPVNWVTTNEPHADGVFDDAEYYGWINDPDSVDNWVTDKVIITNGATVTGGTVGA